MIDLTIEELALWVIGIPLIGIGLVTLVSGMKYRSRKRGLRQQIVHCRICGHLYKDVTREKFPNCPQCECVNERGESHRLG